ncbi:aldo/keto reductase family domain-containing protein [Trichoderma breve]|uniref:Aldo/keto reductase family domain-containing protein n=1 Tax=Trichoderma breve TaxID=2034170 RepID=A0A9W9B6J3_9HYPO|nr:aldo/keto reductase family domain-containing protein [Trichoderma breve]KAJ4854236.1 aldo/keto reductase family domain-containing protein [Trichoderma breve]
MNNPLLLLRDGNKIPMLAFGTGTAWLKKAGDTNINQKLVDLIKTAIDTGFYHLHCAEMYGNEEEVGRAIQNSGIPREKFFITNKVSHGIGDIDAAIRESLKKMQLDYFGLYLIHTPYFADLGPDLDSDSDAFKCARAEFQRKWKSMEKLKTAGLAKSIGVSNYLRHHVEATLDGATIPPVFNQIEFHPYLQRGNDYLPWLCENGLKVGSFKGLTPAFRAPDGPLREPLSRIAEKYGTTEAAVLIKWIIQKGVVAVTTTTNPDRLDEYAQALKFTLEDNELQEITDLGLTYHFRTSWPEHFKADDRS